jgi:NADPH:quinone reductase-like Zn-dependent oxidoreductase
MKAVRLEFRGGPEAIVCGDVSMPRPAEGELLVHVRAVGVTPTELEWMPTWTTPAGGQRPFPIIPGHEFSGEVRAVGPGVTDFAEGAAIFGMNDWYRDGTQAEYCIARAVDVAAKPRPLDHTAAAVTPISALTAWQGLIERARLCTGERVLVHGAAGAVGAFAVQIARWRGAHVIGTASAHNLDYVRDIGAEQVIDYGAERFEDAVREADVVFDTVGGEILARSWGVLKPGGRMITIAASGEQTSDPKVRDAFFIVEPNALQLAVLASLIDGGEIRPEVGAIFPLNQARQAYEHEPSRGKVALEVAA